MTDKTLQQLVIFEGPDCGGKSTAMQTFSQAWPNTKVETVHHGPYPKVTAEQLPRFYLEHMFGLFQGDHALLMDRSWLSEPIYGETFRGKSRLSYFERRHLERIALRHGAVVVLCLPPWEAVEAAWLARKGADEKAEYLDKIEQLKRVYDIYDSLEGQTDLPVVRYDYSRHAGQVRQLVSRVRQASTGVHHEWFRKTAGSLDAKVILVGEAPSEPCSQDTIWQFPFCSFSHSGSSGWLTDHLHHEGIREQDLYWINASDGLIGLNDLWQRPVICLGQKAAERFRQDCRHEPDAVVAHPQFQKRFKAAEPYNLAETIRKFLK